LPETPTGIGNVAYAAVLEFRPQDRSNQLGEMVPIDDPNDNSTDNGL